MEENDSIPKQIGRYNITKLLGEGAMGRVYLATDPQIGRFVAIKTIRTDLKLSDSKNKEYLTRFSREAKAAGRLTHPNIVAVYDIGNEQGLPWIAIEYVDGSSFKDLRRKGLPALPSNVLWMAERIVAALDAAHKSSVVHRDVKPANILVSKSGEVKVTDFGIARLEESELTREGVMLGSPSYMSPEQVRGKGVGKSSDFFSTAVILYEWITGQRPFDGSDLHSITHKIIYEDFLPPSQIKPELPIGLDRFFAIALAKKPEERYSGGVTFLAALKEALAAPETNNATLTMENGEPLTVGGKTGSRTGERGRPEDSQLAAGVSTDSQTIMPPRVGNLFIDITRGSGRRQPPRLRRRAGVSPGWLVAVGIVAILAIAAMILWLVQ